MAIKNYKDLDPNKVKQSIEKFGLERTKGAIGNAGLLPNQPTEKVGSSGGEQINAKGFEEGQVKVPDVNQYTPKSTVGGKIKIPGQTQDNITTNRLVDEGKLPESEREIYPQNDDVDSQGTFQEEYAKWEMDNKLREERARIEKEEGKAVDTKLKEFERGASNYEKNRGNYTNYNKVNDLYNSVRDAKIELYKEFGTSELTDEQNQTLADRFGIDVNNIKDTGRIFEDNLILSEEGKKNTGTTTFDQGMSDAETNFKRTKEDMKTNLQNMKDDTELAIDGVQENIDRNVQFATAQGAWTGGLRSSGYAQGIQNIKDDGQKIINKLSTSLERYEGTDTTNLERLTEDYNKGVQRATDDFNSQIKDIKYNAGLKLNGLTEKYGAGSEALTEALNDIAKEYQSMDMAAVGQFQQLLRNEQIRTNAAIDLYDKEQEIVNEKLNVRFNEYTANNGELLQNTNLNTLAQEVTAGTLSQAKLTDLKNIMTNSIQSVLGMSATLTGEDLTKINTLLSEGNTPAQVMAEMRKDERFTQAADLDSASYQDWAKYDDNFLYNKRTGEFKNAATGESATQSEATNITPEQAKLDTYTLSDGTQITATKGLVDGINSIMDTNSDIQFDISNLYRTQEDQYALYGKGRTAEELTAAGIDASYAQPEENIVTWTTNSPHMEGNAVDVILPEGEDKVKYFEGIDAEMNKAGFFRPEETIARGDYGHYEFRGIDRGVTGVLGVPISYERQIKQMVPSTLMNSEIELEQLNDTIKAMDKAGMPVEDAVLTYLGFNVTPENKENAFEYINVGRNLGEDLPTNFYATLSNYINNDRVSDADRYVSNIVEDKAKKRYGEDLVTTAGINQTNKDTAKLESLIRNNPDKIGAFDGNVTEMMRKFKDYPEMQKLATLLTMTQAQTRKHFAGSAVTPSEMTALQDFIGGNVKMTPNNLLTMLKEIKDRTESQFTFQRKQFGYTPKPRDSQGNIIQGGGELGKEGVRLGSMLGFGDKMDEVDQGFFTQPEAGTLDQTDLDFFNNLK